MENPLVSIVTINYEHPDVTCALLESLRHISYPNIEVIVVDNASVKDDPAIISRLYPEAVFIQSKENLGFAGGNNLGIRQAKGEYIMLLNNDTEVDPGFIEPLVEKLESNPEIGAVSPKIKFFFQPDTIQFAGQAPINPYTMRSYGYGYGVKDGGQFDRDEPTSFVHGAAMMIPMKVIREVGMMAEIYFLYYEELDWGTRIRAAGYELWYVYNSTVMHKESISTGRLTPFKTYYMNRARVLYLRRNVHGFSFLISFLYQMFVSVPKNTMTFFIKGQWGHGMAYVNAILWHVKRMFIKDIHTNPAL
jgi:GT2 family glycosyltransferase